MDDRRPYWITSIFFAASWRSLSFCSSFPGLILLFRRSSTAWERKTREWRSYALRLQNTHWLNRVCVWITAHTWKKKVSQTKRRFCSIPSAHNCWFNARRCCSFGVNCHQTTYSPDDTGRSKQHRHRSYSLPKTRIKQRCSMLLPGGVVCEAVRVCPGGGGGWHGKHGKMDGGNGEGEWGIDRETAFCKTCQYLLWKGWRPISGCRDTWRRWSNSWWRRCVEIHSRPACVLCRRESQERVGKLWASPAGQ